MIFTASALSAAFVLALKERLLVTVLLQIRENHQPSLKKSPPFVPSFKGTKEMDRLQEEAQKKSITATRFRQRRRRVHDSREPSPCF
jgi:hypothetical protein